MDRPPGEHWLAEYREGDIRLLYDSFGRLPSAQWQPRLQGIETTDPDAEQPPVNADGSKTEWCGLSVVAHTMHYCRGDECESDDDVPNAMYS